MTEAKHRKAVRPAEEPRAPRRAKGRIKYDHTIGGYRVRFPFIVGRSETVREMEVYSIWRLAMGEYREHDRKISEPYVARHAQTV